MTIFMVYRRLGDAKRFSIADAYGICLDRRLKNYRGNPPSCQTIFDFDRRESTKLGLAR